MFVSILWAPFASCRFVQVHGLFAISCPGPLHCEDSVMANFNQFHLKLNFPLIVERWVVGGFEGWLDEMATVVSEKPIKHHPPTVYTSHLLLNCSLVCYLIFSFAISLQSKLLKNNSLRSAYVIVNQNQIVASMGQNPPKWNSGNSGSTPSPCDTGVIFSFDIGKKLQQPQQSIPESWQGRCSNAKLGDDACIFIWDIQWLACTASSKTNAKYVLSLISRCYIQHI